MAYMTLLTGPERRRRWSEDDRRRIMTAAFSPGAVVTAVARENDISTALIYKWRQQARGADRSAMFAPAVLAEESAPRSPGLGVAAITVMLAGGTRVRIGVGASASLVTATLRALR